ELAGANLFVRERRVARGVADYIARLASVDNRLDIDERAVPRAGLSLGVHKPPDRGIMSTGREGVWKIDPHSQIDADPPNSGAELLEHVGRVLARIDREDQ